MSDAENSSETGIVLTAKTKNGGNISLQSWFMLKLGTTAGERMFKDFVTFTAESTQSLPGVPGVILDARGGRIVSVNLSS